MRFLKRNIYDKLLLEGLIIFQVLKKAELYRKISPLPIHIDICKLSPFGHGKK